MNRTLCVLFEGSQASGSRRSPSTARRWRSLVTFRSGFWFFSDLCATIGILALVVVGLVDRKFLSSPVVLPPVLLPPVAFRSGFRFFSDLCAFVGFLAPVVCGLGRPEDSVFSGSSPSGVLATGDFSDHRRLAGFLSEISFLFFLRRSTHL